jgi:peptide/nickel transport system permease protein
MPSSILASPIDEEAMKRKENTAMKKDAKQNQTPIADSILSEVTSAKEYTFFQMVLRRFLKHKLAITGMIIISILILLTLSSLLLEWSVIRNLFPNLPDPTRADIAIRFMPPLTPGHLLGTDDVGRDVLFRILYGGRISLTIGFIAAISGGMVGGIIGSISGYFGGWLDSLIMRIVELFFSTPTLPILVILSRYFGGSPVTIILILVVFGWAGIARMVRGLVMQIKNYEYIEAAKAIGCSNARIIMRHVFPNTLAILLVQMTLAIGGSILFESTLSFLGLGVNPAWPTWGNMLSNAQSFLWNAVHLVIWPGLCIFMAILSFNFLGDGLRDALDPKLKNT